MVHNTAYTEVTCLSNKWMDYRSTHWLGKAEDEEDRWTTGINDQHKQNDAQIRVRTHLDARERRCETFVV